MNEARDENRNFFNQLTENKSIRTEMYRFKKRMQRLIDGTERSQMLVGPPGCGKDTAIYPALDEAGVKYQRIVDVSVKALKEEFDRCAQSNIVAIINDADSVFWQDVAMIELLMRATGDDAGRVDMISNMRYDREYSYVGLRLIIVSNRDPYEIVKSQNIRDTKLDPLFRRMKLSKIDATMEDRFLYTCYLIICENIFRKLNYPVYAVNDCLEHLTKNRTRVKDVSPGMVKNMLIEYMRPDQDAVDNWRNEFESWCMKGDFPEPPDLGRIPRLIGANRGKATGARPQPRTAADVAYELSERIWALPSMGSLRDHPADLGYLYGLLHELQRLAPTISFENAAARAASSTIRAPEPAIEEAEELQSEPAIEELLHPEPTIDETATEVIVAAPLRDYGLLDRKGDRLPCDRQAEVAATVRGWWQEADATIDSPEGRKLMKTMSLQGRTKLGLGSLGMKAIERILADQRGSL